MRELVDTRHELEAAVSDYQRLGFDIMESNPGRAVLRRGYRGSALWHLLFFAVAPFYGNLVYAAFRRFDRPERVIVRVRGFAEPDPTPDAGGGTVEEDRREDAGDADPVDDTAP